VFNLNKLWVVVLVSEISVSPLSYGELATTPPESRIVTVQVHGEVTSASLEGNWDDLGIVEGSAWYGQITYDISRLDELWSDPYHGLFSFPPLTPPDAYFRLWVGGEEFSMYGRFEVWTSYDTNTSRVSLGCSHSQTGEGGEIYTPWELALGRSLNAGPDTYLLELSELNVSSRAPDSLPYDLEFAEGGFGELHLFGSLSLDNSYENADAFDYMLGISQVEVIVPEPGTLSLLGVGALALLLVRRQR